MEKKGIKATHSGSRKNPDGSESYFIGDKVVTWDEFRTHMLFLYEDVRLFYFEVINMRASKKEVVYWNKYTPIESDGQILIHEIPDSLITKDVRDRIIKAGAIDLSEEDRLKYIFSKSSIDFVKWYFKEPNKNKFKVAGHLKDQQLKYTYPKDRNIQLSIFDNLLPRTKQEILQATHTTKEEIVEGIKLSPAEQKVVDSLCKLLHKGSQNSEPKREDYYTGNIGSELTSYSGEQTQAPRLGFTLYELTKEYKGGEGISGKDVDNVKNILQELDKKRFLLSYKETTFKKDGGRIERKIEDFRKLIHIVKLTEVEYNKSNVELSKKEESIVLLSPIFRRQIDSKFILYPDDINKRTIIAYGSHNISDIALRLRDYLMREHSSKRYNPEISVERLYYLLAEKWMGEGRRKKVKEYTEKALETCINLGLLQRYEIVEGATGDKKVVFSLNDKWE